jgi:putative restriction endonuclease
MTFYLGVTDLNWYNYLSQQNPEDINFWQPGGKSVFKLLPAGGPFLFKLKSPVTAIAGIGFFSSQTFLPISIAWEIFNKRNGCESYQRFQKMILQYRKDKDDVNPSIGCIVLTNPIFFRKDDWIAVPEDWSKSIVQGKSYSSESSIGVTLWNKVEILLEKYLYQNVDEEKSQLILEDSEPKYGKPVLKKVRLGQGAFRVLVTDAYERKCAISGEKTLPVLEAAHIKPYTESGPHFISNSLLLRSDLHKLFDAGYLTISSDHKIEVSRRIKEEFENGREYYKFHGNSLTKLPNRNIDKPDVKFIQWHNTEKYKG